MITGLDVTHHLSYGEVWKKSINKKINYTACVGVCDRGIHKKV